MIVWGAQKVHLLKNSFIYFVLRLLEFIIFFVKVIYNSLCSYSKTSFQNSQLFPIIEAFLMFCKTNSLQLRSFFFPTYCYSNFHCDNLKITCVALYLTLNLRKDAVYEINFKEKLNLTSGLFGDHWRTQKSCNLKKNQKWSAQFVYLYIC